MYLITIIAYYVSFGRLHPIFKFEHFVSSSLAHGNERFRCWNTFTLYLSSKWEFDNDKFGDNDTRTFYICVFLFVYFEFVTFCLSLLNLNFGIKVSNLGFYHTCFSTLLACYCVNSGWFVVVFTIVGSLIHCIIDFLASFVLKF